MTISTLSTGLYRASWALVCFIPASFVFDWYLAISQQDLNEVQLSYEVVYGNLELWQWSAGVGLTALPMLTLVAAFKYLSRLMNEFSQGHYFSLPAINYLHRFSTWLLVSTALGIVIVPLLSVALTLNNPVGERWIMVSLESDDLYAALIALVFFVVTRILQEGRRLDMENAEFI